MKNLLLFALLLIVCTGCVVSSPYVKADKATYEAVAPEYSSYVFHDPFLSPEQKKIREDTLTTWKRRIEAGEREVAHESN